MNAVWRLLAQRQFSAVEATLSSDASLLSSDDALRVRALVALHRDGVSAAMRLAPLPHDVFLQCFERAASLEQRRDIALTQLRACAADPRSLAYAQALELTLFHVLIPRAEFDAAEQLVAADRVLSAEHREFFAVLVRRAKQESATSASDAIVVTAATAASTVDTATPVVVSRRLAFVDDAPSAVVPKRSMSWQRYLLLMLLGASSVGVVYRAWLWWWTRRRPAAR